MDYKKMSDDFDGNKKKCASEEEKLRSMMAEAEYMKKTAFFGVLTTTISVLVASVIVPMMYSYAIYIQVALQEEVTFCNQKAQNLRSEFDRFIYTHDRPKRETGYQFVIHGPPEGITEAMYSSSGLRRIQRQGQAYGEAAAGRPPPISQQGYNQQPVVTPYAPPPAPSVGVTQGGYQAPEPAIRPAEEQCCSCAIGNVGPPGPPGQDGHDGGDGSPGEPGQVGSDAVVSPPNVYEQGCNQACPEGPPGQPGRPGPKGNPGQHGEGGASGMPGTPGGHGSQGPPGPPGMAGMSGYPGPKGENGEMSDAPPMLGTPGPPGPPGQPGQPGPTGGLTTSPPGPPGPPGDAGPDGTPGKAGSPGADGEAGAKGDGGGCSHCPSPRTAPGY